MKPYLLGLSLILSVSFLDLSQGILAAWAYDLPAAQTLLKQKEYEKVIAQLSPEIENLNREALFVLAKAYSSLNKHEAAIKAYTACMSLNPKDFEAKTLIGAEQLVSDKDKEALFTLKEALEINPHSSATYKVLIRYYEKKKNKYELRLLYEDLVEKVGETSEAVTKLCELSTQDRLYDIAAKHCQRGVILDPHQPLNYVYLGIIAKETGNKEKAEENFKKAAQDFPQSEFAQLTYAQFLDEHKNYIASYSFYKRTVAADPKSVAGFLGLGNSCLEIQKYAESLEAFDKACTLDKKALSAFRRATNTLRTLKATDWIKKFEAGVEKCN